jgi:hypothetical protein
MSLGGFLAILIGGSVIFFTVAVFLTRKLVRARRRRAERRENERLVETARLLRLPPRKMWPAEVARAEVGKDGGRQAVSDELPPRYEDHRFRTS